MHSCLAQNLPSTCSDCGIFPKPACQRKLRLKKPRTSASDSHWVEHWLTWIIVTSLSMSCHDQFIHWETMKETSNQNWWLARNTIASRSWSWDHVLQCCSHHKSRNSSSQSWKANPCKPEANAEQPSWFCPSFPLIALPACYTTHMFTLQKFGLSLLRMHMKGLHATNTQLPSCICKNLCWRQCPSEHKWTEE